MKKIIAVFTLLILINTLLPGAYAQTSQFKLGNEVLLEKYRSLLEGKKIGLVTNQSGVDSKGRSLIDIFAQDKNIKLVALYGPEHGIDGKAAAGAYVESYTHPTLKIPVYSLYGATRMPTKEMLAGIDLLVFDIQDIGARSYTYISTLNYCMVAAQKYNKPILVLDRPNPVGGTIVEGPVLEDKFKSFVGIDNLPMAHGMTIGELAQYFNRKIGANLTVIPMEGYTRSMLYQDTGLNWLQTSPNIPDLASVFGYMATGLGEGTGIYQADKFKWIGGKGIDPQQYADLLNQSGLAGVTFIPEKQGTAGGVRLQITDPSVFNPARTGIYALATAYALGNFQVPKSEAQTIVMFDKIMGTDKIGQYLEQGLTAQQIEARYAADLEKFKTERQKYLLYGNKPVPLNTSGQIAVLVNEVALTFDSPPYLSSESRLMVPLRAIVEALGAEVAWIADSKEISITRQSESIVFTLNSTTAVVNGAQKIMDTRPVLKNNRTMVPVRYIAEYFGAQVEWDSITKTVFINK